MILEMHEDCEIPISAFVTNAFPVAQAELQSILPNQAMLARAAWRYTESWTFRVNNKMNGFGKPEISESPEWW